MKKTDPEVQRLVTLALAAKQEAIDSHAFSGDSGSTWRNAATLVLTAANKVLPADCPEKTVRAVFSAVYPFGPREMHPHKIWCSEVKKFVEMRFPPTSAVLLARHEAKMRKKGYAPMPGLFSEVSG